VRHEEICAKRGFFLPDEKCEEDMNGLGGESYHNHGMRLHIISFNTFFLKQY